MRKKILFAACAWLLSLGHATADELTIGSVTIPQGGTAELTVGYGFTSTIDKVGFTFSMALPEGVSFVTDADGDPVYVKDAASIDKLNIVCADEGNFAGQPANSSATIKGTSGTLLTLTLQADASLAVGSAYEVCVTKVTFQQRVDDSVTDINLDDFTFTVTIGQPADTRTVLDESSATAPVAETNANVRVRRTIKADEWSTICLPFAMTETQCKAAFGDDVELADFTGCDVDDTTGDIRVNFSDVTAIEANHPYIIKVSEPVTEFFADGVDITPEEEPYIDRDEETTGSGRNKKTTYNSFIGTYVAETVVPDYALFLSDNQFWFSTGNTKMKAFRAYFDLATAGAEYEDEEVAARILMVFNDGETTGISALLMNSEGMKNDKVYNLKGQRVAQPSKGLYIKDGRKVVVK